MRKFLLPFIILFTTIVIILRLFFLQVVYHDENTSGIDNIAIETVYDYPERGYIYDRNGELLVSNQPAYDVMVIPSEVKNLDTLELCSLLELSKADFAEKLQKAKDYSRKKPSVIVHQLSNTDYAVLQEKMRKFEGFYIQKRMLRSYLTHNAGNVLGYISEVNEWELKKNPYYLAGELIGRSGVEKQYEEFLKHKNLSPESVFGDSATVTLYNHELRNAPLSVNTLKGVNYDRIIQIWKERYANPGQFVYYFVGNYDEATLRPLIEKYIGCLPKGKAENWKEIPGLAKGKAENHFTFKSETPKAMSFEFWHQPMKYTLENSVLVDAAAQVLSMVYLKDIREDQGAAYSVGASGGLNQAADKTFAIVQAQCPMDPKKAEIAVKLLNEGIKNNSVKVDADKLQKVKDFMLKQADISAKSNDHWINVLNEYITLGVDIQTGYKAAVEALTPEKIAAFLKGLLAAGNHVEVVMTPAK